MLTMKKLWLELFMKLKGVSDDFMPERKDPPAQEREPFE